MVQSIIGSAVESTAWTLKQHCEFSLLVSCIFNVEIGMDEMLMAAVVVPHHPIPGSQKNDPFENSRTSFFVLKIQKNFISLKKTIMR